MDFTFTINSATLVVAEFVCYAIKSMSAKNVVQDFTFTINTASLVVKKIVCNAIKRMSAKNAVQDFKFTMISDANLKPTQVLKYFKFAPRRQKSSLWGEMWT